MRAAAACALVGVTRGIRVLAAPQANASSATAALWSLSSIATDVEAFTFGGLPFALPAVLRVYVVDTNHNGAAAERPIEPTTKRRFESSAPVWSGTLQPHATVFLEVVPAPS